MELNQIASKIKVIRHELGLTMKEFGQKFEPPASDSIVSRWERGISAPNSKRLKRIAELGKPGGIMMDKNYEKIEFTPGDTIEQAVNELIVYNKNGQLVYGIFNGVYLYSDLVSEDFMHLQEVKTENDRFRRELEAIRSVLLMHIGDKESLVDKITKILSSKNISTAERLQQHLDANAKEYYEPIRSGKHDS